MNRNLPFKKIFLGIILLLVVTVTAKNVAHNLFFSIGKTKFDQGDYISAQYYLKQSLLIKPDNKDYRYYYVKTLLELPATYDVQMKIYKFAQQDIEDSATIIANQQLIDWKQEIMEEYGNNYIEQAPQDSDIIRWNKKSFPLKIYIENDVNIPDYYRSAIAKALNQWDKAFDFVSFTNANNSADAKIHFLFKDLPKDVCNGSSCLYVVGHTTPTIKNNTLHKMTITLYKTNPKGTFYTDAEVYNVILHEIGHALGILGHSYSTEDLMYQQTTSYNPLFSRFRNEYQYLTGSDINTLNLLYRLKPTITDRIDFNKSNLIYTPIVLGNSQQMLNKKIAEYKRYIDKMPHIATGYINLAAAYSEAKEYNKAIYSLKKGIEVANSKDEKYMIYYNFAVIYMKLNERVRALEYAGLASSIKNTDEVRELIGVIQNKFN